MEDKDLFIILRTFSGPNLGAEVMLAAGVHVIGTDFSCDVVLSDSAMAPRHAALTVKAAEQGQEPQVHLKPLDADVLLNEKILAQAGQEIERGTPWFLGLTCFSWNIPGAPRETFIPSLPGQVSQPANRAATEGLTPADGNVGGIAFPAAANVGERKLPFLLAQRRWLVRGALCLVVLLLVALSVGLPDGDNTAELAESFRQQLHAAGFTTISVAGADGRLTVVGTVLNEQERAKIWSLARNLKCPAYIRVGVRDDVAKGVTMKLNSSGIFPRVTFPEGKAYIRVAAYIKDMAAEERVFAALAKDMPDLPHLEKYVVYAAQLREVLQQQLDRAGFRQIALAFSTGRVELRHIPLSREAGPTGMASQAALERILQETETSLGIPLAYTIISQEVSRGLGKGEVYEAGDGKDIVIRTRGGTDLAKMQIAGVTFGVMRFVILDNGQRIFEGGALPDGQILERITFNALILSKDGRSTSYLLRGTGE